MESPGSKIIPFRCGLTGLMSKEAPDLLTDGQYRQANNVTSQQEGSISSRNGIKEINFFTAAPNCYFIRKLVVQSGVEDPFTPTFNPRYLGCCQADGSARNIYRSNDYSNFTLVASNVDSVAGRHWEMADYAASESGTPWAYFACPNGMLKDRGTAPYSTLHRWGVLPATGVCLAAIITGDVLISSFDFGLLPGDNGLIITTAAETGLADFDMVTIQGVPQGSAGDLVIATTDGTTDINGTWAIRIGWNDADGNINNPTTKFRIYDTNGSQVTTETTGVIPVGAGVLKGVAVSGNLDGGSESSKLNTQPYDWVTVWEEMDTGDKGNPSQFMSTAGTATLTDGGITYSCQPLKLHNATAKVVIWNSPDQQIGFIRVYRRGGILVDMGRLVARIDVNDPGWVTQGAFKYYVLTDNMADEDLQYKEGWELDNDPPVVSTVPSPISSTSASAIGDGWQGMALSGAAFSKVTPGTLVHIIDAGNSEDVYCTSPTASGFNAFFQFTHGAGAQVSVDAITGQNCNLVATVGEATLVAGDINNPHILYKSKTGAPQAFPVGTDMAGAVTSIGVGTPANGIVNLTECRGQALCLNVSALFEVAILSGSLTQPVRVSGKGLRGQSAWCKTDTEEIWFLSDDGVYSWDGASTQKRSEAIDPVFHNMVFNGISPLDMTADALNVARMEFRRGLVYLSYKNLDGHTRAVVCHPFYHDRWMQTDGGVVGLGEFPITMLYAEPDTKSLVIAVTNPTGPTAHFGISDASQVVNGQNVTSDWWRGTADAGNFISWGLTLPWFDMGNPATEKLFEEIWLDIDPQLYTTGLGSSITVDLYLNYSDTAVETFQLAIPTGNSLAGRTLLSLLPNMINTGVSINQAYGQEARAISFRLSGFAVPYPFTLYRVLIQYQDTGLLSAGAPADWMDLGSKHDKRLYQMTVVFDSAGIDRQIVLEPRGGRDGKTIGTPQVFTLSSPTNLTAPAKARSGRCMKVFPLADPTVGKLFRVRPYATAAIAGGMTQSSTDLFRIFDVTFPDAEEYPPDIVTRAGEFANGKVVQPWTKGGYDFEKYVNQIALEVNTNGVAVQVQVQADGITLGSAITIQSTDIDRKRNITMPTGLKGIAWSLFVDPNQAALTSGAGMFQLFNLSWKFQPVDPGEVGHTFAWDDLGHPYDKLLLTVDIEYDTTFSGPMTLQMDTLSGIGGNTITSNVARFTLGSGRGKTSYPIPPDTMCKMIRLYPASTVDGQYRQWKYLFQQINYPADTVRITGWKDASAPVDKEPSWLWIDADTSNVAANVQLQNENGTVLTVNHLTRFNDRKRNYAIPIDTRAKMWRLISAEGSGGRFQLFDWGFERWGPFPLSGPIDPPEIIFGTPWKDAAAPVDKEPSWLWIDAETAGSPVTVQLQNEHGTALTVSHSGVSSNRKVNYAIPVDTRAKMWRLVVPSAGRFQLYDWGFERWGPFPLSGPIDPPEIILGTPWKDAATPVDKEPSWLWIDAETGGLPETIQLQNENGAVMTVFHTGASSAGRKKNYATPTDTRGKMWRLVATVVGGGKFQLYDWGFERWGPFALAGPVDPPEIILWTPWKDADAPLDKEPSWLWIEAETGGAAASIQLVNEAGAVMAVSHTGTGVNRKKNYATPVDAHAKMWRLVADPSVAKFQLFNWGFERWAPFALGGPTDPPEIILATPWNDFGYQYDKIARNLSLTIDTGGVPCFVALQTNDAGTVFTTPVTGTFTNRRPLTIACPSDLTGKLWRLVFTPGTNGKAELWDWALETVQVGGSQGGEPAAVTSWDSYELTLGSKFFKFIDQGWWMYTCDSAITLRILSGTGVMTVTLPPHTDRDTERFPLAAVWGSGLNKSKTYRVQLNAATPFKFYPAGSGLEYMIIGGDRHAAYQQSTFSEVMELGS